jgi:hypothetical protein
MDHVTRATKAPRVKSPLSSTKTEVCRQTDAPPKTHVAQKMAAEPRVTSAGEDAGEVTMSVLAIAPPNGHDGGPSGDGLIPEVWGSLWVEYYLPVKKEWSTETCRNTDEPCKPGRNVQNAEIHRDREAGPRLGQA